MREGLRGNEYFDGGGGITMVTLSIPLKRKSTGSFFGVITIDLMSTL